MIPVTRINGTTLYVNAEFIQFVEATPDTIITLSDGKKLVVVETPEEIARLMIDYKRRTNQPWTLDTTDENP
jgi:flagellar protein FlbD